MAVHRAVSCCLLLVHASHSMPRTSFKFYANQPVVLASSGAGERSIARPVCKGSPQSMPRWLPPRLLGSSIRESVIKGVVKELAESHQHGQPNNPHQRRTRRPRVATASSKSSSLLSDASDGCSRFATSKYAGLAITLVFVLLNQNIVTTYSTGTTNHEQYGSTYINKNVEIARMAGYAPDDNDGDFGGLQFLSSFWIHFSREKE